MSATGLGALFGPDEAAPATCVSCGIDLTRFNVLCPHAIVCKGCDAELST